MGWGGRRPGAGRKPDPNKPRVVAKPKLQPKPDLNATVPAEPKRDVVLAPAIDPRAFAMMLPEIEEISKRYAKNKARDRGNSPFRFPIFPKQARPPDPTMAMDAATSPLKLAMDNAMEGWLSGEILNGLPAEGLLFLGYTYLSELAQRPEYRVMSETIADDATRRWIDFDVTGDEKQNAEAQAKDPKGFLERMADPDEKKKRLTAAGKMDKVKALKDDQERLEVRQRFYEQCRNDGFFGRSHLYMDIRTTPDAENSSDELKTPIGNGRSALSKTKCPKGGFIKLKTIEPVWTYPLAYNATNPLAEDWYNPQVWYVMGQEIHGSRLRCFIGHPVPDMLKPAYAFGGLSLSQMAKPYVDIWLQTRQSVADLIHSFSVMVLMTDLSTMVQPGNVGALMTRIAMFNMMRDNQGAFVVNKNTEDFKNVSASLSGLHELQSQAQEHMASVSRIPLVKFTGIQPAGLNASSEGEIKVYDDTIAAYQMRFMDPTLKDVINFEHLHLWGEVDPEITFHWEQLRQLTDEQKGQKVKDDADTRQKYVDMGSFSPQEVRKIAIDDPDLPFAGLDPDDVPEPPAEEGLLGPGAGGAAKAFEEDGGKKEGAEDDDLFAQDEWNESDHPRADNGQFGSGGGSGGGNPSKPAAPLKPSELKRVGNQMGSNPGGVFANSAGEKFYVKKLKSPAHVRNELAAVNLYRLAGVPTLDYRPVEGGNHVATSLAKLDVDRAGKMSPEQKKKAAEDFVAHAWLANWDAVGMGGDNLGVVGGKPTALDVGGALSYRAQGAQKGNAFGTSVGEVDTLRDPKINPDSAKLFGNMTDEDLRKSAEKVTSIRDGAIRAAVQAAGEPESLAEKLIARKLDIARRFKVMAADEANFEESKHPRSPDGKFTSGGGGGSSGGGVDIKALLNKKPIAGSNYRKALVKAIAAATDPADKEKLTENLIQSWYKTAQNAADKGDFDTVKKIASKVEKLGSPSLANAMKADAEFKANAKKGAPAPEPAKVEPPKPEPKKEEPVTPAEIAAAKKSTKLQLSYIPGAKPSSTAVGNTEQLIQAFNDKWAGKSDLSQGQLVTKVGDFKKLQGDLGALAAAEQTALKAAQEKAAKEAKEKAEAAAKKAAEDAKRAAEKNKKYMDAFGISQQHAEGLNALAKMLGKKGDDLIEEFKAYEKKAENLGYPLTGLETAVIQSYSNGTYSAVNAALRSGAWTPAQHVYVSMINKALSKMPAHTGTLNRGAYLSAEEQKAYVAGHIIQEPALMSTSTGSGFSGNTKFKVTAIGKRGADIQKLSHYPGEKEVLFQARTFFKVDKVEGTPGGSMTIHMTEWEEH